MIFQQKAYYTKKKRSRMSQRDYDDFHNYNIESNTIEREKT